MTILKACPHCGAVAKNAHLAGSAWFIDADHTPDCHLADFHRTEAEAVVAWNRRSPDPEVLTQLLKTTARTIEVWMPGVVRSRHDGQWWRLYRKIRTTLGETDTVAKPSPEPPWPVGTITNCKREGWKDFFEGRSRDACPFPMDRRDLHRGYLEGWDAAQATTKDPA